MISFNSVLKRIKWATPVLYPVICIGGILYVIEVLLSYVAVNIGYRKLWWK